MCSPVGSPLHCKEPFQCIGKKNKNYCNSTGSRLMLFFHFFSHFLFLKKLKRHPATASTTHGHILVHSYIVHPTSYTPPRPTTTQHHILHDLPQHCLYIILVHCILYILTTPPRPTPMGSCVASW